MFRRSHIVGCLVGIALAIGVIAARSRHTPAAPPRMISECDGALAELVIHAAVGDTTALPVYQRFLPQLSADVRVHVLCEDRSAFDELIRQVGPVDCELLPLVVGHALTVWSRDRWVATATADGSRTTILPPLDEDGSEIWPARRGDARAGQDLAAAMNDTVSCHRMGLYFDGGDLLADDHTVFVTPAVLTKNLKRTVASREELIEVLTRVLGRRVVLLNDAPDHHAGMFMMAAADRTMLVGDPRLGLPHRTNGVADLLGSIDLSEQTQRKFDAVAAQVEAEGYRVVRVPTLVALDAKTYFTYVNVTSEIRDGRRIVYMPVFDGVEAMNEAAAEVWRSIGYEVRPINCTSSYRRFGNLHCLVNVLRRSQPVDG